MFYKYNKTHIEVKYDLSQFIMIIKYSEPFAKTKTTSVSMPLPQLGGVGNFYSNVLSPFPSIARIQFSPYSSKSFNTPSSHNFLGQPFFLFPVISISITSHIWELMSPCMTWSYHQWRLWIITFWIFTTPTLSQRTSFNTLSMSLTIRNILIIQLSTPHNFASSTTVISIFPHSFKDKPCFPSNLTLNFLNFLHAPPILALTALDAPQ